MDANEMFSEEATEVLMNETVNAGGQNKGLKVTMGVGAIVLCGLIVCRYVVAPLITKHKGKKAAGETVSAADNEAESDEEVSEET